MIAEGYPAQQVLLQLQALVVPAPAAAAGAATDTDAGAAADAAQLTDKQRAVVCELAAAADKALVDGADEFLQLLHVAGSIQAALSPPV